MTNPDQNAWPAELFNLFQEAGITLFPYIPDAGNARLIELAGAHNETRPVLLTTEDE